MLSAVGFARIEKSLWLCGSTNPGQTILPVASITRSAVAAGAEPADVGDLAVLDRDVAEVRRAARAVGDPAVPDQDVEHDATS